MPASIRIPALLVAALLVAVAASCSAGGSETATLAAVDGRGLQPAWWAALPNVDKPEPEADEGEASEWVPSAPEPEADERDASESVPSAPESFRLPADALFDVGEATVRPGDLAKLTGFGEALADQPGVVEKVWAVVGATDSIGDENVNYQLGLDRAEAVIELLSAVPGLDLVRFVATSWGETCPAADEATATDIAEARALNRRVELVPEGAIPTCPIPD